MIVLAHGPFHWLEIVGVMMALLIPAIGLTILVVTTKRQDAKKAASSAAEPEQMNGTT